MVVLFRQLLSVLIFVVLEVFNVDCCRSGCCPLCIGHCWLLSFGNFYLCLRTSFVEPALIVFSCTCSVLVVVFSMLVVLAQHHLCARTSSAEPPLRLWQATWPTLTKRAIHLSTRGVSVFVTVDLLWSGQSVRSFFLGRFWTKIRSDNCFETVSTPGLLLEGWHCFSSNFVYNFNKTPWFPLMWMVRFVTFVHKDL